MLRKFLRTLVCMLLVVSLLGMTAYAETGKVTGSDVNLRSGPGTGYRVVDTLPAGATVTVTDQSNGKWYAVSYNGKSGYMSANYIRIEEESYNATVISTSGTGYISSDYVRFRSGPSSNNSVIATYNRGKELNITGTSGGWTACTIDGRAGYIYSDFVSAEFPSFTAVVQQESAPIEIQQPAADGNATLIIGNDAPAQTQIQTQTQTNTGTGNNIVIDGGVYVPAEEPAAPVTVTAGNLAYISADFVSFRSGPSSSNSILSTYNKGKELTVTGSSGAWIACVIDGRAGYVYSQYVTTDADNLFGGAALTLTNNTTQTQTAAPTPSPTLNSQIGYITGNNVRFRSGASSSTRVLSELFYGNVVTITGTAGEWTAIAYGGQTGYVYKDYVTVGSPQSSSSGGTATGRQIADYALQFVGYPYSWGGKSPATGFDCSGLMYYVYSQFGYTINRVASEQAKNGVHVDPADLQPGDLLCFYSGGSYIGHVGMYVGNNMFVHAATSSTGVITEPLSGYYASRGFEARRII